jgi:hypothetical protein
MGAESLDARFSLPMCWDALSRGVFIAGIVRMEKKTAYAYTVLEYTTLTWNPLTGIMLRACGCEAIP